MTVNQPEVLAELTAAFHAYEDALLRNDVDALNQWFWGDEQVLRYGLHERTLGHAQLCAYRAAATPVNPGRSLQRTVICTFGSSFGSASTEFQTPGSPGTGRQTQTWVKFDVGWRIVAAHVSELAPDGPEA